MRRLLAVVILILSVPLALSQTTAVTATVADTTNSTPYANGTYRITLVDSNNNPLSGATLISTGGPVAPTSFGGVLDSTGSFAANILPNSFISPPASKWLIQVCSQAPSLALPLIVTAQQCLNTTQTISGSSQSLTSVLSSLAPTLYYFNPVTGKIACNGGCGGGGGGATFPSTSNIVTNLTTTTSRNATTTDVSSLLQTASGCGTSGTVYSPISNTCVNPGGGASLPTNAITYGLSSSTSRAATTSDMSTLLQGAGSGGTACTITNSLWSPQANGCFTPAINNSGTTGQFTLYPSTGSVIGPNSFMTLANSTEVDTATNGINTGLITVTGNQPQIYDPSYANASTGGSVPLFLNKITSSGVVESTTSDTGVVVFPVASSTDNGATVTSNGITICTSGTSGNACIVQGRASVTFDSGGGSFGQWCVNSTITNGTCHAVASPSGQYCVGLVTATVAANAVGVIDTTKCTLQNPAGNGTVSNSSTAHLLAVYPTTGTTVQGDSNIDDGGTTSGVLTVNTTNGIASPGGLNMTGTQSLTAGGILGSANSRMFNAGGAWQWTLATTSTLAMEVIAGGVRIPSGSYFCWSSNGTNTAACDTSGFRKAAGIVELGTSASIGNGGILEAPISGSETVSFSSTPTFSTSFRSSIITLTASITSFTLAAGLDDGQEKTLIFCQNGTGGFTVTPPSNVHGFFTIGTTASKCNAQHFTYSSGQTAWIADSAGVINQ